MKYLAFYPLKLGSMAVRSYETKGAAIGQAKRHYNTAKYIPAEHKHAEVWEVGKDKETPKLIWNI